MIRRIFAINYRGFKNLESVIPAKSVCAVFGSMGSGKTSLWQTLSFIQSIARGASSTAQVFVPSAYSRDDEASSVAFGVDFSLRGIVCRYSLVIRYDKSSNDYFVQGEKIENLNDANVLLERTDTSVCLRLKASLPQPDYPIDPRIFALSTYTSSDPNDPIVLTRDFLAGMFVVAPDCNAMKDDVRDVREYLLPNCSNFCSWAAAFFSTYPAAYMLVADALKVMLPSFGNLAVRDFGSYGRKMYVELNDVDHEIPFEALSESEKKAVIAAVLRVACQISEDEEVVVWDSAFSGFENKLTGRFVWDARTGLGKGQFVYLTSDTSLSGKFAKSEVCQLPCKGGSAL